MKNLSLRSILGLDLRALAIFRISLGLISLGNLIVKLPDIKAFYTDQGIVPRKVLYEHFLGFWDLSLHSLSGSVELQIFLFACTIIAALAFTVGIKTRVAHFFLWVLTLSMFNRNPLILNGGDSLLCLLLFWSMFLPLKAYWSVDASLSKLETKPKQIFNCASVALIVQIVSVYYFSAVLKSYDYWWLNADAAILTLKKTLYVSSLGLWLLDSLPNEWLQLISRLIYLLELGAPFLLLIATPSMLLRKVALILLFLLHTGLFFTMHLGLFPLVSVASLIPLMPAEWMDLFSPQSSASEETQSTPSRAHLTMTHVLQQGVVLVLMFYVLHFNSITRSAPPAGRNFSIASVLGLRQYWRLFSEPKESQIWFFVWEIRNDGTKVDFLTGLADDPKQLIKQSKLPTFSSPAWRRLFGLFVLHHRYDVLMPEIARYVCDFSAGAIQKVKIEAYKKISNNEDGIITIPITEQLCD